MQNQELDRLKAEKDSLFERKQAAFARFTKARDDASRAHDAMNAAWQERERAREVMNREFEARQSAYERHDAIWEEYHRIRDGNNYQLDYLKRDADSEHEMMKECFDRASNAYEYGDRSEAPALAADGHEHRARRDELNARIGELIREIREAREYAEAHAPKVDSSAFDRAKSDFEYAKSRHAAAEAEFNYLKAERERAKAEFDELHSAFKRAQEAFHAKLDELKRTREAERNLAVSKVNMELVKSKTKKTFYLGTIFGENAKVIPRNDGSGKTDVYFAGLHPAGDGIGHGHAVIESDGSVTYLRDAWASNDDDYLIDDRKKDHTKI